MTDDVLTTLEAAAALKCTERRVLDAAWAEAEAALPEGWEIDMLKRLYFADGKTVGWRVVAGSDYRMCEATGSTPVAALRALAKLRDKR